MDTSCHTLFHPTTIALGQDYFMMQNNGHQPFLASGRTCKPEKLLWAPQILTTTNHISQPRVLASTEHVFQDYKTIFWGGDGEKALVGICAWALCWQTPGFVASYTRAHSEEMVVAHCQLPFPLNSPMYNGTSCEVSLLSSSADFVLVSSSISVATVISADSVCAFTICHMAAAAAVIWSKVIFT